MYRQSSSHEKTRQDVRRGRAERTVISFVKLTQRNATPSARIKCWRRCRDDDDGDDAIQPR